MSILAKLRLPYREDVVFSLLGFAVFLTPLIFSAYAYESFESVKFSTLLLCVGAALFAFFWKKGKVVLNYNKYLYGLLVLFGFWAVLSSIFSLDRLYSLIGFYYRYTSGLAFYAVFLVFIFLLFNTLTRERLEYLLKILVLDAFLVAIISFVQGFGWLFYPGLEFSGFFRGPSLLGNADFSAMFMAVPVPLVIYFLVKSASQWSRLYYGLAGFFILLAEFILASRGALLAIACSLGFSLLLLLIFKFPKKLFLAVCLGSLAALVLGYLVIGVSRPSAVSSIITSSDANTSSRFYAWEVSLKGVLDHPFLGSGPGAYELFFEASRPAEFASQIGVFDDAHNIFLNLADTGGLPLVLLFIAVILTAIFYGFKELKTTKDLLPLILMSALLAWTVGASFNPIPIPMYLLFAILIVGLFLQHIKTRQLVPSPVSKYFLIFLGSIIFAVGLISLVSEHFLGFAQRSYNSQNYQTSYNLSNAAYDINPTNKYFLSYKVASAIKLKMDRTGIITDIKKIQNLHPTQAETYISASNM
ncbi:MAG TPA: O-antigen ligase family protein, partial [Candidatus Limnocylindria bacterium]|nr:O-antigen ligase family protein [Candidatus Limnocylindria bacterium]